MKTEDEWHKCNYCNKEFLSKERLEDHRQVIHLGDGSKFVEGCLSLLFKMFGVLLIIAIIALGAVADWEYRKQNTKEAIEELKHNQP